MKRKERVTGCSTATCAEAWQGRSADPLRDQYKLNVKRLINIIMCT